MTINITFDHYGRTKVGKAGPVEIRITSGKSVAYYNTGVKVRRSEFRNGEIVNRADAPGLNELLSELVRKAYKAAAAIVASGERLDGANVRRRMAGGKGSGERGGMLRWLEEQVSGLNVKPGTKKHYDTLLGRLGEFGLLSEWGDLTVENICKFDAWLHGLDAKQSEAGRLAGLAPKKISDGGVFTYHKCLKSLLNRAVLFDKIRSNPYDKLRGKFKRGDNAEVDFLDRSEIKAFEALRPMAGSPMAVARDLFVFQMHTGLSYADTQSFDFTEYKKVRGKWVNAGRREKTGVQYITELSKECMAILRRYGMGLPKMDNSDYNKCLKALGMAAGIGKPLHSHVARHTFATRMLASGARVENVSRMLGHTNIAQTQRYAKILPDSVLDDFDKANL